MRAANSSRLKVGYGLYEIPQGDKGQLKNVRSKRNFSRETDRSIASQQTVRTGGEHEMREADDSSRLKVGRGLD